MPGLFAHKLVAYKKEGYIQNIDPSPLSGGMPNAPVSFTVICSNNSSIKKSPPVIIPSSFFVASTPKQLKNTCQPYKICYKTAYVTAAGFQSLKQKKK